MGPLHTVSDYAIQLIKKMQNENIRSWVPRQDIVRSFISPHLICTNERPLQ